MSIGEEFYKRKWRQGSYLPRVLIDRLVTNSVLIPSYTIGLNDQVILISHDCDINYRGSIKNEPNCEVLLARHIKKRETPKRHGMSTRYFQFCEDSKNWHQIWSAERFFIPRESLSGFDPSGQLSPDNLRRLTYWMANRYKRAAFPNAFDLRLRPKESNIESCLREKGTYIKDIYLRVSDDEIEDFTVPYQILGIALMDDADYQIQERRQLSIDAVDDLTQIFLEVNIQFIKPFSVESDEEVAIASIIRLKRWNWDVISYDTGDEERTIRDPSMN